MRLSSDPGVSLGAAVVIARPLRPALADEQHADAFEQVRRFVHALGQEDVGE